MINANKKKLIFNNKIFYYLYKLLKIFKNKKKGWYFAEFAEDVLVARYLKKFKKGVYVDVGCYHPYKGNLTFKLFKKGWKGLNIDLSKVSIDLFEISRPRDINVCCAVSDVNKQINYRISAYYLRKLVGRIILCVKLKNYFMTENSLIN